MTMQPAFTLLTALLLAPGSAPLFAQASGALRVHSENSCYRAEASGRAILPAKSLPKTNAAPLKSKGKK